MGEDTVNLTAEEAAALQSAVTRIVTSGMRLPEGIKAGQEELQTDGPPDNEAAGKPDAPEIS